MARRSHKPDPFHRRQVEAMAGYGVPELAIARVVGIDPKTLRRHYREELDTGQIKATAKVAESLFRKATGLGVLEYQIGQRMARARELLDTTDMPIGSIARAIGYQDPFYFSRHFRHIHGVSASQYRSQHKG